MDLQLQIWNSMIFTFMGALLDFFISVIRGITIRMSAPVSEQYRCLMAQYKKEPDNFWALETEQKIPPLATDAMEKLHNGTKLHVFEATVQPEQLMILQLVDAFMDDLSLNQAHHHHQSHMNLLANQAKQSQPKELETSTEKMDVTLACNLYDLYSEPNFCYFFIDVCSHNSSPLSHKSRPESVLSQSDKNNNSNIECSQEKIITSLSSTRKQKPTPIDQPLSLEFVRQRSISECSEDSFICFTDEIDDENVDNVDAINPANYKYYSTLDSDTDNDETETDYGDDEDDVDMCSEIEFGNGEQESNNILDCNNSNNNKKVRFNMIPEVHVMHTWNFAYRSARKGDYWQAFARDHARFQQRILRTETILGSVLKSEHRQKIFDERFKN